MQKIANDKNRNENPMLIPVLKNVASKFHEKAATHRRKAEQQEEKSNAERYAEKSGGQWNICKDMAGNFAAPLVAVKRIEAGPQGQATGTIATSPKEVDGILRKVLGKSTTVTRATPRKQQGVTPRNMTDTYSNKTG